jgi:hypothetical protein
MTQPQGFADLSNLTEDERITLMGTHLMATGDTAGIVVDKDPPEKRTRYIQKLMAQFPQIEVIALGDGPTKGSVYFKARRKPNA